MRPIAACAMVMVERTRVSQVTPETPSIPRAMVLTVSCALSRRPGFLATVAPEKLASQELDASVGASGPHAFSVRLSAVRYRRIRVHRIPPRVRDDREPPLEWDGTANHIVWFAFLKNRNIFAKRAGQVFADLPVRQIKQPVRQQIAGWVELSAKPVAA